MSRFVDFFSSGRCGAPRLALWSSGAAALLHKLHYCTGCTLCARACCVVGLAAVSAVVRVMQGPPKITYNSAAQAPAVQFCPQPLHCMAYPHAKPARRRGKGRPNEAWRRVQAAPKTGHCSSPTQKSQAWLYSCVSTSQPPSRVKRAQDATGLCSTSDSNTTIVSKPKNHNRKA